MHVAERRDRQVGAGLLPQLPVRRGCGLLPRLNPAGDLLPEPTTVRRTAKEQDPAVRADRSHGDGLQVEAPVFPVALEGRGEVPGQPLLDVRERRHRATLPAKLGGERRHAQAGVADAARHDGAEVGEIGVDVEGKAVGGDPAGEVHPHRPHLPGADPGAAVLGVAPGRDSPVGAGPDHRLLERGHELPDVRLRREVHHRVGHDLAGPVVGDVPSPVGLVDLEALEGKPLRRGHHVRAIGSPAQRQDRRVLEEEEPVRVRIPGANAFGREPHELEAVGVLDPAQLLDPQRPHGSPSLPPAPPRPTSPGAGARGGSRRGWPRPGPPCRPP